MGAVGAIVLAAIHDKGFSSTGHKILIVGVVAAGIGTIVAMLYSENLIFRLARGHLSHGDMDLPRGGPHSGPARPDQAGLRDDHAHHLHGHLHPDRLDLFLGGVPWRLRWRLARASADVAARRRLGLPDLHQHLHLLP